VLVVAEQDAGCSDHRAISGNERRQRGFGGTFTALSLARR
jgi:hypothetical protein